MTFNILADGSATFAGVARFGIPSANPGSGDDGTIINPNQGLLVTANNLPVFRGYALNGATPTSTINSDGSATFKNTVDTTSGSYSFIGRRSSDDTAVFAVNQAGLVNIGPISGSNSNIVLSGSDGSATFAGAITATGGAEFVGNVTIGEFDVTNSGVNGIRALASGKLQIQRQSNAATDARFEILQGTTVTTAITGDGNASFAGSVTSRDKFLLTDAAETRIALALGSEADDVLFKGFNDSGSVTSLINQDGSAEFDGKLQSKNSTNIAELASGASTGFRLLQNGTDANVVIGWDGSASFGGDISIEDSSYIRVRTTGDNSSTAIQLGPDGTATFGGEVGVAGRVYTTGTGAKFVVSSALTGTSTDVGVDVQDIGGRQAAIFLDGSATFSGTVSNSAAFVSDRSSGTSGAFVGRLNGTQTAEIKADGSATFAGRVDAGIPTLDNAAITASGNHATKGVVQAYHYGAGKVWLGGDATGTTTSTIGYDGSATFASGNLEVTSGGQVLIDTANSTALRITNSDESGNKVVLGKDGSGTFAGDVKAGERDPSSTSTRGVRLATDSNNGGCYVQAKASATAGSHMAFQALHGTTEKFKVMYDGSATFAGKAVIQDTTIETAFSYANVKTGAIGFWSPDNWYFGPDVSTPSSAVITLNATDGSATFGGKLTINDQAEIYRATGTGGNTLLSQV